ncbi:MAG TPA: DUF4398 domain-containing protein, partial [Myxococcota bacterium]|nr:DUF4398 domain-containing protein [Myxococcota bacterium]
MARSKRGFVAGLAFAAFGLGCVSAPPPIAQEVRAEYAAVSSDPRVAQHAAIQLDEAQQALQRLEAARRSDDAEVAHLAYVAKQRLAIARAAAEAGAAEEEVEKLGEQRDELRLQARSFEADAAKQQAAESAADAETARDVAASAIDRARDLEERVAELKAKETERGLVMTMSDVLFEFNSAQLLPGSERALGEVAKLLNDYPDRQIAIEGHTDS